MTRTPRIVLTALTVCAIVAPAASADAGQDLRNPDQRTPAAVVHQDLRSPDRQAPAPHQDLRNPDRQAPAPHEDLRSPDRQAPAPVLSGSAASVSPLPSRAEVETTSGSAWVG